MEGFIDGGGRGSAWGFLTSAGETLKDGSGEDGPGGLSLLPSFFPAIAFSATFLSLSLRRARNRAEASGFRIRFGSVNCNLVLLPGTRTCTGMGLVLESDDCVVDSLDSGVSTSSSCRLFDKSRRVSRVGDSSSSTRLAVRRLKIR